MHVIATMHSAFPAKFGIPRQSGLVDTLRSTIVFQPEYRNPDALRRVGGVLPPLGGVGVFPSGSEHLVPHGPPASAGREHPHGGVCHPVPFRPNPIGLSCVKIDRVGRHPELGPVIHVLGADLLDGTPILDLKPYLPYADAHPEAAGGIHRQVPRVPVGGELSTGALGRRSLGEPGGPPGVLAQDPRPSYQADPQRVYGMAFGGQNIRFTVAEGVLTVVAVE